MCQKRKWRLTSTDFHLYQDVCIHVYENICRNSKEWYTNVIRHTYIYKARIFITKYPRNISYQITFDICRRYFTTKIQEEYSLIWHFFFKLLNSFFRHESIYTSGWSNWLLCYSYSLRDNWNGKVRYPSDHRPQAAVRLFFIQSGNRFIKR